MYDPRLVDYDLIAVEALHIVHYLGLLRVYLAGDFRLHIRIEGVLRYPLLQ